MNFQADSHHGNNVPGESWDSGTCSTFHCVASNLHGEQEVGQTESDGTRLSGQRDLLTWQMRIT